jgi:hypothetical protein
MESLTLACFVNLYGSVIEFLMDVIMLPDLDGIINFGLFCKFVWIRIVKIN